CRVISAPTRSEIRLDQAHQRQWHGMPVFVSIGAEIRDHNIALAIHKQQVPGKSALEDLTELAHAIPLIAGMAEPGWLLVWLHLETCFLQQGFHEGSRDSREVQRLARGGE